MTVRYVKKTLVQTLKYYGNPVRIMKWLFFYKIYLNKYLYIKSQLKRNRKKFLFDGKEYSYYIHQHNNTFYNERAVELSLAMRTYNDFDAGEILEVGDVLSHYLEPRHFVIDKYENARHVSKADAADYKPGRVFSLIVSISTLEHIGFDDVPRDPERVVLALSNLFALLKQGGKMLVTVPIGYNVNLDSRIFGNELGFTRQFFMKRLNKMNEWAEVPMEDIKDAKYGNPFPAANALFIGIYERPSQE